MPRQSPLFPDSNYIDFLDGLKQRIRSAQIKAALAVNRELVLLYWHIGREILARQEEEGWGSKVIERPDRTIYPSILHRPLGDLIQKSRHLFAFYCIHAMSSEP